MRRLARIPLPRRVLAALAAYQRSLDQRLARDGRRKHPDPGGVTEAVWKGRRANHALAAVEIALSAMASGLERCMYCEDSHGCDVEHFRPKARHPQHAFVWENLLFVCTECNRQKNDTFDPLVIDPTKDDPLDHVVLSPTTGKYVAATGSTRGAITLRAIPRLASDQALVQGRRNAWMKLHVMLGRYAAHQTAGRQEEADMIRQIVVDEPFSAVFAALLRASTRPGASDLLGPDLSDLLARHPEVHGWLADADRARAEAAQPRLDAKAKRLRIARKPRLKVRRGP